MSQPSITVGNKKWEQSRERPKQKSWQKIYDPWRQLETSGQKWDDRVGLWDEVLGGGEEEGDEKLKSN